MVGAWWMHGGCMVDAWWMHGRCMVDAWWRVFTLKDMQALMSNSFAGEEMRCGQLK